MDRFEAIETTRFLGAEFLTWLWFKLELFEGHLELGEFAAGEGWLDGQLTLQTWSQPSESVTLRGSQPGAAAEAAAALRQGRVPVKAGLRLSMGTQDYAFTLNATSFALSGVKLPAVLAEDEEERFYERIRLLQDLDRAVAGLYQEFLALRISRVWEADLAPAIRAWVRKQPSLTRRKYAQLLKRARQAAKL